MLSIPSFVFLYTKLLHHCNVAVSKQQVRDPVDRFFAATGADKEHHQGAVGVVARAERYAMYHGKRTFLSELANTPSYSSLSSKTQPAGYRQQLMFCGMSKLARRFNFIGRYENFATDVTKLMASVGVKLSRVVSEEGRRGLV